MAKIRTPRGLYQGPRDASYEVRLTDTGSITCAMTRASALEQCAYWDREGRPYQLTVHEGCLYPGCDGGIPGPRGRVGWVDLPRKRGRMFADAIPCPQCAAVGVPDPVVVATSHGDEARHAPDDAITRWTAILDAMPRVECAS